MTSGDLTTPSPTPSTASPTKPRQEEGSENRKWNTYGVACRLSVESGATNKNRKKKRRKVQAGCAGGEHEQCGIRHGTKMERKKTEKEA